MQFLEKNLNSSIGDAPWADKRKILSEDGKLKSCFPLVRGILDVDVWDSEQCQARQELLIKKLFSVYDIQDSVTAVVEEPNEESIIPAKRPHDDFINDSSNVDPVVPMDKSYEQHSSSSQPSPLLDLVADGSDNDEADTSASQAEEQSSNHIDAHNKLTKVLTKLASLDLTGGLERTCNRFAGSYWIQQKFNAYDQLVERYEDDQLSSAWQEIRGLCDDEGQFPPQFDAKLAGFTAQIDDKNKQTSQERETLLNELKTWVNQFGINWRDADTRQTPLISAVRQQCGSETVKFLVEFSKDIDLFALDRNQKSAYYYAKTYGVVLELPCNLDDTLKRYIAEKNTEKVVDCLIILEHHFTPKPRSDWLKSNQVMNFAILGGDLGIISRVASAGATFVGYEVNTIPGELRKSIDQLVIMQCNSILKAKKNGVQQTNLDDLLRRFNLTVPRDCGDAHIHQSWRERYPQQPNGT